MTESIAIGGERRISLDDLTRVARDGCAVQLDRSGYAQMLLSHAFFAGQMQRRIPIYGLNTQFGDQVVLLDEHLHDYESERYETSLQNRQSSLVRSHNCGLGETAAPELVRGAMLLRAQCLARGYSGVRPKVVESYLEFLNRGIVPLCYRYGSIGASGDLVPLATIAAAVVGEDVDVRFQGQLVAAPRLLAELGLHPLRLQGREGLALINGTSFMSSVAGLALADLTRLFATLLDVIAMALESLYVIEAGYFPIVHALKGHHGELHVASSIQKFWTGSQLIRKLEKARSEATTEIGVQDYYSLR
ncbi:MAG TPA: aromatic amino acid ammonia-lyase, partial [Polyangiaceae bacterium]